MEATTLVLTFAAITNLFGLPPGLLSALCYVESNHKVHVVSIRDGGSASYGVCQVKLGTARGLGFKGTSEELRNPEVNIHYAGMYLKRQLNRYDGVVPHAIAAYNAGSLNLNDKGQIRNKKYVNKVFAAWEDGR